MSDAMISPGFATALAGGQFGISRRISLRGAVEVTPDAASDSGRIERRFLDRRGGRADSGNTRTTTEASMASPNDELLTPAEVADLFRVNPKTVTRWARAGKISSIRTIGGHRRFRASEVQRFLENVRDLPA
jgi:excisionase family DNA binding protein